MLVYVTGFTNDHPTQRSQREVIERISKLIERHHQVLRHEEKESGLYQQIFDHIKAADLLIAEITHNTPELGYEITLALSQRKSVLALFAGHGEPSLIKQLNSTSFDQRFIVAHYTPTTLEDVIIHELDDLKRQVTQRFTILLPTHIINHLEFVSQRLSLPKSVYIRKLIEADMQNH